MKKRTTFWLMMTAAICMLSGCSNAQSPSTEKGEFVKDKKVLIVYLSRTHNTEAVAKIIQQEVGGRLVKLELVTPYPKNYQAIVAQVDQENETGYLPPLKTKIDSMEKYDVVFVGAPTWDMQLPPPMKSFLHQYDLNGKTVVPFNTNGGYGIGSSFETVNQLCRNSTVLEGFTTRGGSERDGVLYVMQGDKEIQVQAEVQNWLEKIGLVN